MCQESTKIYEKFSRVLGVFRMLEKRLREG